MTLGGFLSHPSLCVLVTWRRCVTLFSFYPPRLCTFNPSSERGQCPLSDDLLGCVDFCLYAPAVRSLILAATTQVLSKRQPRASFPLQLRHSGASLPCSRPVRLSLWRRVPAFPPFTPATIFSALSVLSVMDHNQERQCHKLACLRQSPGF